MEMVGDFKATDLIFKGCYGDSLLYSDADLCQLRWRRIHLPMFQEEIPMPPAPSYQQVREPTATTQSQHRAAALATPVGSPRAKCSGSKSIHRGSGHGSNTLTPKHPDSTSTKKPSSSKESTSNGQEKSPKACSSHKWGHLPSPTARSTRGKQRELHMEDPGAVDTTLPISSSMFDGFCSLTGFFSDIDSLGPSQSETWEHHLG